MKVYWVYEHFPAFLFVTNVFVSANAGATTFGPLVFIRPSKTFPTISKERAEGLREHELVHVKQFYRTCGFNGILYLFSKKWRMKYEIEAYREQLKYVPESLDTFATYLVVRYRLNVTFDEMRTLLSA